jgi:hypothetical protein
MKGAVPSRDRGGRGTASRRAPGSSRTMPGAGGLVGGVENDRSRTKKAAGVESDGGEGQPSVGSAFDGVDAFIANLLACDGQPVVLRQRTTRAQHGPGGVFLPAHRGHDLLERYTLRA